MTKSEEEKAIMNTNDFSLHKNLKEQILIQKDISAINKKLIMLYEELYEKKKEHKWFQYQRAISRTT